MSAHIFPVIGNFPRANLQCSIHPAILSCRRALPSLPGSDEATMLGLRGLVAAPAPAAAAPPRGRCSAAAPPEKAGRVSLAVPAAAALSLVLWTNPGTELAHYYQVPTTRSELAISAPVAYYGGATHSHTEAGDILSANCSERRHPVRFLGVGVDARPGPAPARVPGEMEWSAAQLSHLVQFM